MTRFRMYWTLFRTECGFALEAVAYIAVALLIGAHASLRDRIEWAVVGEMPPASDFKVLLKATALCMALVNVVVFTALTLIGAI